jgi:LysR family transcriptional regulator, cys regulon transcriptional activator
MNLHQFRFVQEAVRRNLNLTEAAKALHTSQPGVSKAIIELEDELGIEIFTRHGKRIKRITEPGQHVLRSVEIIMREVNNLKRIGEQFSAQDSGTLSIATTHTQARYVLPHPVAKLRQSHPKVNISLHQGSPDQVAKMLLDDQADIGIATESLTQYEDLITLPCYDWQHVLVLPFATPCWTGNAFRWKTWRRCRSSPTTRRSPGAPASTRPSACGNSSPTWCWRPSTRT